MCSVKPRIFKVTTTLTTILVVFGVLFTGIRPAFEQQPPTYEVDPFWPQELPDNQIMGAVGGLTVDSHDHIWVLQRPGSNSKTDLGAAQVPPISQCCFPAKPVMEFDTQGKLLQSWGGPGQGYDWPSSEHGIYVDKNDNVWIAGAGFSETEGQDRHVLKFTRDGHFLMQIGHKSSDPYDSSRTDILGQPTGIAVDEEAHEVYISDGYGNRRIIVYDSETGAFKRLWSAYGNKPDDAKQEPYTPDGWPPQQFSTVHAVHISNDGLVYVCDRGNDRIQVFTKQGKFMKEFPVRIQTLNPGSVWDLAFSSDKEQKYLFVADGQNNVVWILARSDGKILGSFGHHGRNAGQFHWLHGIASDSAGNLYTAEVENSKRIQKFLIRR